MKALEVKTVFEAVKKNVAMFVATSGEYELVGLDDFTPKMLDMFDSFFEREVSKLRK